MSEEKIQTFADMVEFAEPIELAILNVFKQVFPLSEKIDNWTCDIDTHSEEGKVEIKAERIAALSKKFWVEVSKTIWNEKGERIEIPSGLKHTESKWWIQIDVEGEMFFVKTEAFQQYIDENKDDLVYLKDIKTNQGGYYTYNNSYFVPYTKLAPFSRWHGNIRDFTPEMLKFILK